MSLTRAQRLFPDCFDVTDTGCWSWTRGRHRNGYGVVSIAGRFWYAHRAVYEFTVGDVPAGLELDHVCRNRLCVNPEHLEPVTRRENLLRSDLTLASQNSAKTACPQGHSYDEQNTIRYGKRRYCRSCRDLRNALKRAAA